MDTDRRKADTGGESGGLADSAFQHNLLEALPKLRAYALALTRSGPATDDLMQEVALNAWRARQQFQPGTNLTAWLYCILRNSYVSSIRRRKETSTLEGLPDYVLAQEPEQEQRLVLKEVFAALSKLPTGHREVLILTCVQNLSYEEAAQIMGCSVGTIKSKLWRARHSMQRLLGPRPELQGQGERRATADQDTSRVQA